MGLGYSLGYARSVDIPPPINSMDEKSRWLYPEVPGKGDPDYDPKDFTQRSKAYNQHYREMILAQKEMVQIINEMQVCFLTNPSDPQFMCKEHIKIYYDNLKYRERYFLPKSTKMYVPILKTENMKADQINKL